MADEKRRVPRVGGPPDQLRYQLRFLSALFNDVLLYSSLVALVHFNNLLVSPGVIRETFHRFVSQPPSAGNLNEDNYNIPQVDEDEREYPLIANEHAEIEAALDALFTHVCPSVCVFRMGRLRRRCCCRRLLQGSAVISDNHTKVLGETSMTGSDGSGSLPHPSPGAISHTVPGVVLRQLAAWQPPRADPSDQGEPPPPSPPRTESVGSRASAGSDSVVAVPGSGVGEESSPPRVAAATPRARDPFGSSSSGDSMHAAGFSTRLHRRTVSAPTTPSLRRKIGGSGRGERPAGDFAEPSGAVPHQLLPPTLPPPRRWGTLRLSRRGRKRPSLATGVAAETPDPPASVASTPRLLRRMLGSTIKSEKKSGAPSPAGGALTLYPSVPPTPTQQRRKDGFPYKGGSPTDEPGVGGSAAVFLNTPAGSQGDGQRGPISSEVGEGGGNDEGAVDSGLGPRLDFAEGDDKQGGESPSPCDRSSLFRRLRAALITSFRSAGVFWSSQRPRKGSSPCSPSSPCPVPSPASRPLPEIPLDPQIVSASGTRQDSEEEVEEEPTYMLMEQIGQWSPPLDESDYMPYVPGALSLASSLYSTSARHSRKNTDPENPYLSPRSTPATTRVPGHYPTQPLPRPLLSESDDVFTSPGPDYSAEPVYMTPRSTPAIPVVKGHRPRRPVPLPPSPRNLASPPHPGHIPIPQILVSAPRLSLEASVRPGHSHSPQRPRSSLASEAVSRPHSGSSSSSEPRPLTVKTPRTSTGSSGKGSEAP
uniref:Uncharacterized protein n=1 Tax=Toxoplasma gondii (strain ATCC 50861 / VEG) TaxID=432359 RepID=A0A0F7UYL8_TOXGV|nr:TPA: hypothetical protein BN1205_018155 [Toxoplasma gondii VEG]